jgi:alpha,alpha-trehalase
MYFLIEGIENIGTQEALDFSFSLAERWVSTNYCGWKETGFMFEKYDATRIGKTGGGGEYHPQHGFGWTNGLDLYLLQKYGSLNSPTVCW